MSFSDTRQLPFNSDFISSLSQTSQYGVVPDTLDEPLTHSESKSKIDFTDSLPISGFFLPEHSISRLLTINIPYYTIHQNRKQVFVLTKKPEALEHLNSIDQRTWEQYHSYLNKITPIEKASFYNRLKKRHGVNSIRALAKITGEDWSRVAKVLKVLELPEPILRFLRENKTPGLMRYFTEKRLRELVYFKDQRLLYRKFKLMVEDARKQSGLWASANIDYAALKPEKESKQRECLSVINN